MTRTYRFHLPARVVLAAALASSPLLGCAPAPQPAPYYEQAPPQRSLRITAQRKQSQRQQDRDKDDCQRMASGQATSGDTWAQIFTSCMGGRGYMID